MTQTIFVLLVTIGLFLWGAWEGYNADKISPACWIIAFVIMSIGFGFGATIKGFIELFK